jgi:hypothetical protein
VVVVVAGSRQQPLTEEQARPAIEQYLLNERKRRLIDEDRKALRTAAAIQYLGKFAEGVPPAAAAASASGEASAQSSAESPAQSPAQSPAELPALAPPESTK